MNSDMGLCFGGSYGGAQVKKSDAGHFKARTPSEVGCA